MTNASVLQAYTVGDTDICIVSVVAACALDISTHIHSPAKQPRTAILQCCLIIFFIGISLFR